MPDDNPALGGTEAPSVPADQLAQLLVEETIEDAAAEIRGYQPHKVDFGYKTADGDPRKVTIGKLPGDKFAGGLARFAGQLAPAITIVWKQHQQGGSMLDVAVQLIQALAEGAPDAVIWLADNASNLRDVDPDPAWDVIMLVAADAILQNFMKNGAVRVFFGVGQSAVLSAAAETAAAQPPTPPTAASG